jgi:hypothetical protein
MAQALILALGGMLTAVLNRLSGDALHAWIPWFTQRLLDLAIKRLPEDQQERFAEEWAGHSNDVSGDVGKIAFAWGCVSAAREMASLLSKPALRRFFDRSDELLKHAMRPFNFAGTAIALFLEDFVLRERGIMRTIMVLALVGTTCGFLAYLPVNRFYSMYTSTSLVLIESQKVPENMVQPVVSDDLQTRVGMLKAKATSDSEMRPMLKGLFPNRTAQQIDAILDDLRGQPNLVGAPFSDLSQITGSTLKNKPGQSQSPGFQVSYIASDPKDAQRICEALTSKIVDKNLEFIQENAKGTVDVLRQGLEDARTRLIDQSVSLTAVKQMRDHRSKDPQIEARYLVAMADFENARQTYMDLLTKKSTADLTANMTNQAQGERMREIQPASFPDDPDFPNMWLFVGTGLAGGLVSGLGLVLWFRLIRPRFVGPVNGAQSRFYFVKHEPNVPSPETERHDQ